MRDGEIGSFKIEIVNMVGEVGGMSEADMLRVFVGGEVQSVVSITLYFMAGVNLTNFCWFGYLKVS